jgi:hypothetical protein
MMPRHLARYQIETRERMTVDREEHEQVTCLDPLAPQFATKDASRNV